MSFFQKGVLVLCIALVFAFVFQNLKQKNTPEQLPTQISTQASAKTSVKNKPSPNQEIKFSSIQTQVANDESPLTLTETKNNKENDLAAKVTKQKSEMAKNHFLRKAKISVPLLPGYQYSAKDLQGADEEVSILSGVNPETHSTFKLLNSKNIYTKEEVISYLNEYPGLLELTSSDINALENMKSKSYKNSNFNFKGNTVNVYYAQGTIRRVAVAYMTRSDNKGSYLVVFYGSEAIESNLMYMLNNSRLIK